MLPISIKHFQSTLLNWFDQHGRKQLPWQHNKTPYRVWISEIMLQQTQVTTVIPYFERFIQRFPNLPSLASAQEDEVLHLWSGLGYYSRARYLHRAAKLIMSDFEGKFPNTLEKLLSLPGIGQSTGGAILSIAFKQATPILDGNVKRVLSRLHGITTPINEKPTENKLWEIAKNYTPTIRVDDYTQAIMDLGATLCVRSNPNCQACPFKQICSAHQQGIANQLPKKKTARVLPIRHATFLIIKKGKQIFLQKRPATGIWAGLWSVPELSQIANEEALRLFCRQHFHASIATCKSLPAFRHTFSHYHLDIHPRLISLKKVPHKVQEAEMHLWYNPSQPVPIGLPKPVAYLLQQL